MSLISRLRAVVAGDDFLDSDFDELDYETSDDLRILIEGTKREVQKWQPSLRPILLMEGVVSLPQTLLVCLAYQQMILKLV